MNDRARSHALALLSVVLVGTSAHAQCSEWDERFSIDGLSGSVSATQLFDDGSGPALYVGGTIAFGSSDTTTGVARWDGSTWTALGPPVGGVRDFAVFDDGNGPLLYACTSGGILRLVGASWSFVPVSLGGFFNGIYAIETYDSGAGPELYACGWWDDVNGESSLNMARFDGTTWRGVGGGIGGGGVDHHARTMIVHDDGFGPALFVGGRFDQCLNIARWNGSFWSCLSGIGTTHGSGGDGVWALARFDDGSGTALYAAGDFNSAGPNSSVPARKVAKWNGASWSVLGAGIGQPFSGETVRALASFDDGSGPALFAGGRFQSAGGAIASRIAKWNGSAWTAPPPGFDIELGGMVHTLAVFDEGDGAGARLYAGGTFAAAGDVVALGLARLDGAQWSAVGRTSGEGANGSVLAFFARVGPSAERALVVGGSFGAIGQTVARHVSEWNGHAWSTLGSGVDGSSGFASVRAFAEFDDGSGLALYAAGNFERVGGVDARDIARWDGAQWSAACTTTSSGSVNALCVHDDGGGAALYAAGSFTSIENVPANRIARFDGTTWTALGSGLDGAVHALASFDDGSGSTLYAAGEFTTAGGAPALRIAQWDGSSWQDVGGGLTLAIQPAGYALCTFDDGSGTALYVGGAFRSAGGVLVNGIAKWNGTSWSPLGLGVTGCTGMVGVCRTDVRALAVHDDGFGLGPALYAGGNFTSASDVVANAIARWNGAKWTALDGGITPSSSDVLAFARVDALASFDDGEQDGPALYVGGNFQRAGGRASLNIARWVRCSEPPGTPFCFGDGSLATACPCAPPDSVPAPSGAADAGCANAFDLRGGRLFGSGRSSAGSVVLRTSELPPTTFGFFAAGTAEIAGGVAYADGVRCASGTLVRFGGQFAHDGTLRYPNVALGHTTPVHTASGFALGSGAIAHYQVVYRDVAAGFCSPATLNVTNAYRIVWN